MATSRPSLRRLSPRYALSLRTCRSARRTTAGTAQQVKVQTETATSRSSHEVSVGEIPLSSEVEAAAISYTSYQSYCRCTAVVWREAQQHLRDNQSLSSNCRRVVLMRRTRRPTAAGMVAELRLLHCRNQTSCMRWVCACVNMLKPTRRDLHVCRTPTADGADSVSHGKRELSLYFQGVVARGRPPLSSES